MAAIRTIEAQVSQLVAGSTARALLQGEAPAPARAFDRCRTFCVVGCPVRMGDAAADTTLISKEFDLAETAGVVPSCW